MRKYAGLEANSRAIARNVRAFYNCTKGQSSGKSLKSAEDCYAVSGKKCKARGAVNAAVPFSRAKFGQAIPLPGAYLYKDTIIRAGQAASPFNTERTDEIISSADASCKTYPIAPARTESKNARSVSGMPTKITFSDGADEISFVINFKSARAAPKSSSSNRLAPDARTKASVSGPGTQAPIKLNPSSALKTRAIASRSNRFAATRYMPTSFFEAWRMVPLWTKTTVALKWCN